MPFLRINGMLVHVRMGKRNAKITDADRRAIEDFAKQLGCSSTVEHRTHNPEVEGSTPSVPTKPGARDG